MNDKDIIKALGCCQTYKCSDCPYVFCKNMYRDALDLIKRQQAEIEKLTIQKNAFGAGMKVEARKNDDVRVEAIREFAERLKYKFRTWQDNSGNWILYIKMDCIDNLVKEMLGLGIRKSGVQGKFQWHYTKKKSVSFHGSGGERRCRMREILFRGKRVDNGEWVFGYYVEQYGAKEIYLPDGVDSELGFDHYSVIPETVGQFTGLTDKNDKRIFEGDILNGMGGLHLVYFDTSLAWFEWAKICGNWSESFSGWASEYEVIGNIHDNTELLKGGE